MKRTKKLGILLVVLIFACIATFGVTKYESKKEEIKNSGETILSVPTDTIKSFSWEYDGQEFSFHKNGSWIYDADEAFPVDEEVLQGLLEQYADFSAAFTIENVEDYSQYGLDKPECTIKLSAEDVEYEITLGDISNMDQQRYASIGDGNVYLVVSDPIDKLNIDLEDLIKHDDTPLFGDITEIIFAGAENYTVFYEAENNYSYCEDDYYFTKIDDKTVPLDTDNVESYTGKISNLNLKDYVTYNATDDELASYGLDNPQLTVTVNYTDEDENAFSYVINIGRDPDELKAVSESGSDSKENTDEAEDTVTAYARVGDSHIIYTLADEDYKNLMSASYNDLRHKNLFTADLDNVTQIDISLEGENYTITSTDEDDETVFFYNEEKIDITNFSSQLNDLEATEFTSEEPADKKEIGVTFTLNDENSTQVKIELYRYDGESCIAAIDGETVSFISRSDAVDFIEAVNNIVLN